MSLSASYFSYFMFKNSTNLALSSLAYPKSGWAYIENGFILNMCLVKSVRKHFSIFSMVSQLWIIVTKILMTFVWFYSSLLASGIISVNSFVMNLFINLIFGLFAKGFCKFIFWLGFSTSLYRVIKYILDTCKCQHTLTFDLLFLS